MGKKILLADDSITIQKVIELTFSDEDFDVVTVGNGRLALERLPEVRPDIVLCDIIMPEKDGYEVCEQIKANPSWSQIPVLLLTGAFEPFDQDRAARAGYDGSLAKPFEPETLIAKVKELLARAPRPSAPPPPSSPARPVGQTPASAPSVLPFSRPPAPPSAAPSLSGSFIPDEPFSGFEETSFEAEPPLQSTPTSTPLVPVSEEEAASLSAPPQPEDATSTVMFRASDLPWTATPAAPPAVARPAVAEPEPALVPELHVDEAEVIDDEPTVFEAVLEEDLDFGPTDFGPAEAPPMRPAIEGPRHAAPRPEIVTMPPLPEEEESATGAFAALVPDAAQDTSVPPGAGSLPQGERVFEPEPDPAADTVAPRSSGQRSVEQFAPASEPVFEEGVTLEDDAELLEPASPEQAVEPSVKPFAHVSEAFAHVPEVAPFVAEPPPAPASPMPTPAPAAAAAAKPPALWPEPVAPREPAFAVASPPPLPAPVAEPHVTPTPAAEVSAASFADLAADDEPQALSRSETAAVPVPVDMVEKIAQRVVAQISEKAVREIAWEVIPDLAETLIKQEIERLKAELQKT